MQNLTKIYNKENNILLSSCFDNYFLLNLENIIQISNNEQIIIVTKNNYHLYEVENIILHTIKNKNIKIFTFPSIYSRPYEYFNNENTRFNVEKQISTLHYIKQYPNNKTIVITTIESLMHKNIPLSIFEMEPLNFVKNKNISITNIDNALMEYGYDKTGLVVEKGTYTTRGDIIDIFPINSAVPFRISLFDTKVDYIKTFDPHNQKTIEEINALSILPSSYSIYSSAEELKSNYLNYFTNNKENDYFLKEIEINKHPKGIENYIQLIQKSSCESFLQVIHNADIIWLNETKNEIKEVFSNIQNGYQSLLTNYNLNNTQYINPMHYESIYLHNQDFQKLIANKKNIELNHNKLPPNTNVVDCNVSVPLYNFASQNHLRDDLKVFKNKHLSKILILAIEEIELINKLQNIDVEIINSLDHVEALSKDKIYFINIPIYKGFETNKYIVLTKEEILGTHKTKYQHKRFNSKAMLKGISNINEGDLVVHNNYGIGRYLGLTFIKTGGDILHECLEIEYKNSDKLYVPIADINNISRYDYQSENTSLDLLNSKSWNEKKLKAKKHIEEIVGELIRTAAKRKSIKPLPIVFDSKAYEEFAKSFSFDETEDQKNAITDIINDFKSNKIIDRLICGDVGFGKTEVAIRAIFIAANSGYQVSILAPTTLLTNQHFENMKNRFEDFGFKVAHLSRFNSNAEAQEIKKELQSGAIDIIIGTHALLSRDIKFKNLGLLIIDEEQNFGVKQKEYIKSLKSTTNVISITATPIPRTLNLSLTGIKDLSIIATPQVNKIPVFTYNVELTEKIVKETIQKEIERKGQVFFVSPRIEYLKDLEEMIQKVLPTIKYEIVHGRLNPKEIENHIIDFKNQKFDVLLTTNIIEAGIDMHNVNTLIVHKSNLFGLSQLYQLRGRIGRGDKQAFCYFTINDKDISPSAKQRLQILQKLNYLGASFELANYDLDLRGAGNILGQEQSGKVQNIGTELYNKLLEKEIYKQKQKELKIIVDDDDYNPNVKANVPYLIPNLYVDDVEIKMDLYRRIMNSELTSEVKEIEYEMIDRFGKLPKETKNLLEIAKLKIIAYKAKIDSILIGDKGTRITFRDNAKINVEKVLQMAHNKQIQITKNNSIILEQEEINLEEIYKRIFALMIEIQQNTPL